MEVSAKLYIPEKYKNDIINGAIDVSKAVLRNNDDGKIVKHVNLIIDNKEQTQKAIKNVGIKRLGMAGIVTGGLVIVGFGVYKIIKGLNKDKKVDIPECVLEFHKNLNKYLQEASKGILNIDSIDNVLKSIDKIEKMNDPSIKIDFSINEVQELINYIYEFTLKLSKESKNNTMNFKYPSNNSKNNIICLKDYLEYQKELASA